VLLCPTTSGALLTVVAMADAGSNAGSDPGLLPPAIADRLLVVIITTLVATTTTSLGAKKLPSLERILGVDILASTGRRQIVL